MEEKRSTRRGGLVGPVILIGLGVVLLLNNLGILNWSVWDAIFRLWPILLIAAGLDILIGRRSAWGSVLALILTLALVAGALWLYGSGVLGQASEAQEIGQALGEATRAELTIAPAVGSLHVGALAESNNLVAGVIRPISGERVRRDFRLEGETAILSLRSEGTFGPFVGSWGGKRGWELKLSPDVPLDLEISLGAGQSRIDLQDLMVSDVKVNTGVGETVVTLPEEGYVRAEIEGAIGNTVIHVPAGMEARIRFDTALVARQVPDDYQQQGDVYLSPGYAGADNRVDVEVGLAIGNVSIRPAGSQ